MTKFCILGCRHRGSVDIVEVSTSGAPNPELRIYLRMLTSREFQVVDISKQNNLSRNGRHPERRMQTFKDNSLLRKYNQMLQKGSKRQAVHNFFGIINYWMVTTENVENQRKSYVRKTTSSRGNYLGMLSSCVYNDIIQQ